MITALTTQTAKSSVPPQALRLRVIPAINSREDGPKPLPAARPIRANSTGLRRVAALLSCISHNNSYEGRDPAIIPDSLTSGFVADLLGLSISALERSLIQLQRSGLIAQAEGGALRLLDRRALESLIDAD